MILGLALGLALAAPANIPPLVTVRESDSKTLCLVANLEAPAELSAREEASWRVLGPALLGGSKILTRAKIEDYGSQAGIAPRAVVYPDHLSLVFMLPKGGLDVAFLLAEQLLEEPALRDEDVERAKNQVLFESPWSQALWPYETRWDLATPDRVRALYAKAFRPEGLSFVVMGAFEEEVAAAEVEKRFSWMRRSTPPKEDSREPPRPRMRISAPYEILELTGKTFSPAEADAGGKLLALFGLGVGKGASLFRIVRNQLGWSYRQELIMWPTARGWQPRLLVAHAPVEDRPVEVSQVREILLEDVKSWDESSRERALAMLRASLSYGLAASPFQPHGRTLAERALWRAQLLRMGLPRMSEANLIDRAERASLEEMKMAAEGFLTGASETRLTRKD